MKSCGYCGYFYKHIDGFMVGVTSNGDEFYFDNEDYNLTKQYQWHINKEGYVATNMKGKRIYLHRLVMNIKDKRKVTDHINSKRTDCRKSNLRICSPHENSFNSLKQKGNTSSRYKGVTFDKKNNNWIAQIKYNNKHERLGSFKSQEDAGRAYNKKCLELFGKYAKLNRIIGDDLKDELNYCNCNIKSNIMILKNIIVNMVEA